MNKITTNLNGQVGQLDQLILNAQKIKRDNRNGPIHTTAGMNAQNELDNSLLLLIDDLKALKSNIISKNNKMQSNLWQINCYMQDALKHNNKLMTVDTEGKK